MAYASQKALAQAATAEKDAVTYIDCIFHRRYAEHLPLQVVLQDMTQLRNRNALSHVGAMPFCQRTFLQTRTHLYKCYEDEIHIHPKDYRDALTNLVHYIDSRPKTTLADLYAFCSAAYPTLIKGEIGSGLGVFRRFIEEHPTIFEITQIGGPKEPDKFQIRNQAQDFNGVLLFPRIKIAVGRVVNVSGNMAYLECQGEFIPFHSVSGSLPSTAQLKHYITKGDMVPFEARFDADATTVNGSSSVVLAAVGVSSTKLRNAWKAINVELPRNVATRHNSGSTITTSAAIESSAMTSPRSPQKSPFESPARRAGSASSHRPSITTTTADSISINSYMAPLDDATEWGPMSTAYERRRSSVQRDTSAASNSPAAAATTSLGSGVVRRTGSATTATSRKSTGSYGTGSLRNCKSVQCDASTQAGSGRPNACKEVQTDVTDEELILRLIRKYPNLLESLK